MGNFVRKIHGLPEDGRKLLAGICMVIAAVAFFGIWTSFVSSHLVSLAPGPAGSGDAGLGAGAPSGAPETAESLPSYAPPVSETPSGPAAALQAPEQVLSPVAGIADTLHGLGNAVFGSGPQTAGAPRVQGFFSMIAEQAQMLIIRAGAAVQQFVDFIYNSIARYVPANL